MDRILADEGVVVGIPPELPAGRIKRDRRAILEGVGNDQVVGNYDNPLVFDEFDECLCGRAVVDDDDVAILDSCAAARPIRLFSSVWCFLLSLMGKMPFVVRFATAPPRTRSKSPMFSILIRSCRIVFSVTPSSSLSGRMPTLPSSSSLSQISCILLISILFSSPSFAFHGRNRFLRKHIWLDILFDLILSYLCHTRNTFLYIMKHK